ncbi:MAG: metallophosphoesterase [Bacteroidota bacterium]
MKIQYCSDLHLEFPENREYLERNPLTPAGDILILAGDIVPFSIMDQHSWFFDRILKDFKTTYWLPGNHEYYHSDINERSGVLHEKIRDNVFLVNNISVHHGDTDLIFTTLWTRISERNSFQIRQKLSDFHAIKNRNRGFSPADYNEQHEKSLLFLKSELKIQRMKKRIIITHHVPTMLNYPEQYKGDILNEAFAVELFDLIEKSDAEYWIFGHHHANVDEFYIGNTRMLTNQLGYVTYCEHGKFRNKNKIEI